MEIYRSGNDLRVEPRCGTNAVMTRAGQIDSDSGQPGERPPP